MLTEAITMGKIAVKVGLTAVAGLSSGLLAAAGGESIVSASSLVPVGIAVGICVTVGSSAFWIGRSHQKFIDRIAGMENRLTDMEQKIDDMD